MAAIIYEISITVPPGSKAELDSVLAGNILEETVGLPGCFFTHADILSLDAIDDGYPADAGRVVIQLHCKNSDGLSNYLNLFQGKLADALNKVANGGSVKHRVLNRSRTVVPVAKPNFSYSSRPNTAPPAEPGLFTSKRKIQPDVFDGALGMKSGDLEQTTMRFTDFHLHKHPVAVDNKNSEIINKGSEIESRFYNYHAHKASPRKISGAQGISSNEEDRRNPATRFYHGGAHFGQLHPNDGPGIVTGVPSAQQPHEIDRFDNPVQHHGQIHPNDGPGIVTGVSSAQQPHEIDRFDNPVQHHGQIHPNDGLVGDAPIAGVTSANEPAARDMDRFQNLGSHTPASRNGTPSRVRQPPGGVSTFTFG